MPFRIRSDDGVPPHRLRVGKKDVLIFPTSYGFYITEPRSSVIMHLTDIQMDPIQPKQSLIFIVKPVIPHTLDNLPETMLPAAFLRTQLLLNLLGEAQSSGSNLDPEIRIEHQPLASSHPEKNG